MKKDNYKRTMAACYLGYIVQAIVNNFTPLLFVHFQSGYDIPLVKITLLITINFVIQLCVDLASAYFIDKIGYRASIIAAQLFSAGGLVLLTILPDLLPDPFWGLVSAVSVYAIGGGLLEVIISPMLEACPTEASEKERAMSILHSFYCWGHVGVVLLSTAFFALFGVDNWRAAALMWAAVPMADLLLFLASPMYALKGDSERESGSFALFRNKLFWLFLLMMTCSGASEQAVSQWASTLAERGLGVSKTIGDLAGPMAFAFMMGASRVIYGHFGARMDMRRFMRYSCVLCAASYLLIAFAPHPALGLVGCAVCGFSVGLLWPGTYSMSSAMLKGGTSMFALLALAGDVGCMCGPTLAGMVSGAFNDSLETGILAAIIFPLLMLGALFLLPRTKERK